MKTIWMKTSGMMIEIERWRYRQCRPRRRWLQLLEVMSRSAVKMRANMPTIVPIIYSPVGGVDPML